MTLALPKAGIRYIHMEALGGRRKPQQGSKDDRWRNPAFRGYADYMETGEYQGALSNLESIASKQATAYMCSEALWWQCHRSLVSDNLKARGWTVLHILAANKTEEHPYTAPARVLDGQIYYSDGNLFGE